MRRTPRYMLNPSIFVPTQVPRMRGAWEGATIVGSQNPNPDYDSVLRESRVCPVFLFRFGRVCAFISLGATYIHRTIDRRACRR